MCAFLTLAVSDPTLAPRRSSAVQRRARLAARTSGGATRTGGGDGASRPGVSVEPALVVPKSAGAAGARSRRDVEQAEARAALHLPFSPPKTWTP